MGGGGVGAPCPNPIRLPTWGCTWVGVELVAQRRGGQWALVMHSYTAATTDPEESESEAWSLPGLWGERRASPSILLRANWI